MTEGARVAVSVFATPTGIIVVAAGGLLARDGIWAIALWIKGKAAMKNGHRGSESCLFFVDETPSYAV